MHYVFMIPQRRGPGATAQIDHKQCDAGQPEQNWNNGKIKDMT